MNPSIEPYTFISYARVDLRVAETIQKRLEAYHYPAKFIQEADRMPSHPKYLRPVFLDISDLSTRTASYKEELREKLHKAKYMIMLCSHASARAESMCHWEIRAFLENHSEDDIIPVALDSCSKENIPEELHSILAKRNIPIWDKARSDKHATNETALFRIIEFLIRVDGMILHNRYAIALRKRTFRIVALIITALLLVSVALGYGMHQNAERANFEKRVFPYSLVNGYCANFLKPLITSTTAPPEIGTCQTCAIILAMPEGYADLDNMEGKKKKTFLDDAGELNWKGENCTVPHLTRTRPIAAVKMKGEHNLPGLEVYADMVTTVVAVKAVVDYLVTNNPFYDESDREEITLQYLEKFRTCVLEELKNTPSLQGKYEILFAKNAEELGEALRMLENKYKERN